VPFQPAKLIFVGIDALFTVPFITFVGRIVANIWLHQAAIGVAASYDALVDLFECVANFLNRLRIYTEIPFNAAMIGIVVKILVEVVSILALATKQINQGRFSKRLVTYIYIS
jgi:hypothetical protein